jgi:hypothetical protein
LPWMTKPMSSRARSQVERPRAWITDVSGCPG